MAFRVVDPISGRVDEMDRSEFKESLLCFMEQNGQGETAARLRGEKKKEEFILASGDQKSVKDAIVKRIVEGMGSTPHCIEKGEIFLRVGSDVFSVKVTAKKAVAKEISDQLK